MNEIEEVGQIKTKLVKEEPVKKLKEELKQEEVKEEPKIKTAEELKDEFIGKRISVLWTDPADWFDGKVTKKIKGGFYKVTYDDGNTHNHRFLKKSEGKSWEFID
jgi:hypothetical protein